MSYDGKQARPPKEFEIRQESTHGQQTLNIQKAIILHFEGPGHGRRGRIPRMCVPELG